MVRGGERYPHAERDQRGGIAVYVDIVERYLYGMGTPFTTASLSTTWMGVFCIYYLHLRPVQLLGQESRALGRDDQCDHQRHLPKRDQIIFISDYNKQPCITMDVVLRVGWSLLPMGVKVGVGMYYILTNARKTYETVAWVSNMMPSRHVNTEEEEQNHWVWVGDELPETIEFQKL